MLGSVRNRPLPQNPRPVPAVRGEVSVLYLQAISDHAFHFRILLRDGA